MKRLLMLMAACVAAPVAAETLAITNGRVAIGDGSAPINGGTVLIRDGRIVAAGNGVAIPADAKRVDARGSWVTPGIIAGLSQLGLTDIGLGADSTDDTGAKDSPFSAALDVAQAINGNSVMVAIARARGITRVFESPTAKSDIFAGQGALVDTADHDIDIVQKPRAFQLVEFGENGNSLAGGSRTAAFAFFKNAMREAQDYARNPSGYTGGRDTGSLLTRADVAALVPVVKGQMPLLVQVNRASDILQVLALRSEFPDLNLVLVGAKEGWMVAGKIATAKVPVIAEALADLPAAFEVMGVTQSNFGRMQRAGVVIAIGNIDSLDTNQSAGNLVALQKVPGATGLSWDQALAAVTSMPAEVMGMGAEIGSLRPGRRADVVIWDGDPLELTSAPTAVFIDGEQQSLVTRQTKLRDRYLVPQEGDLPKAYER